MMPKRACATVSARIDRDVMREATRVLKEMGLTPAQAFRIMMKRIAAEGDVRFEVFAPNAETVKALEAARRGEGATCNTAEELFQHLNSDD